jgi:hypothetical protein
MADNKQQTAVDFIFDELASKNLLGIFTYEQFKQVEEILKQAKEMEKEKAIKLYIDYENYLHEEFKHQNGGQAVILSFREFYNKTYGGGNK